MLTVSQTPVLLQWKDIGPGNDTSLAASCFPSLCPQPDSCGHSRRLAGCIECGFKGTAVVFPLSWAFKGFV